MLKLCLLTAFIGHLMCWYCDCLITYTPDGRFSAKMLNDNEQLSELLKDMPLKRPMRSIMLGVFALIMSFCGFLALSEWMRQFSSVYAVIMLIGAVVFTTCVIPHHVICGLVEWLYIKATPHNHRLTALHVICLHKFRHITQSFLDLACTSFACTQACVNFRQSDEISGSTSDAQ